MKKGKRPTRVVNDQRLIFLRQSTLLSANFLRNLSRSMRLERWRICEDCEVEARKRSLQEEYLRDDMMEPGVPSIEQKYESIVRARVTELDRDILCPICLQSMENAFLTRCGHSFCYSCIATHLDHRSNCPSCGHYLTIDLLVPNVLLSKLLKKAVSSKIMYDASPAAQLRLQLEKGMDFSAKEIDSLLLLLNERKQELEILEAESNIDILLEFLHRSQLRKQEELHEVQNDIQFLEDDTATVKKRHHLLTMSKDRHRKRPHVGSSCSNSVDFARCDCASSGGIDSFWRDGLDGAYAQPGEEELCTRSSGCLTNGSFSNEPLLNASGSVGNELSVHSLGESSGVHKVAKKRRVLAQFDELQEAYLLRRRQVASKQRQKQLREPVIEKDVCKDADNYYAGLDDFQSMLTAYTRYSHLRIVAELHPADLFQTSSNTVSSIDFDRDDEMFAIAGVSRRIKVVHFDSVVNNVSNLHCPVAEIPTRSKLSCISWNKQNKPLIASSDYEGIVTVWDVNRSQSVMEYEEHEKRAWSVDFSRSDPKMLVSGSDDGKVKVWCTNQEASAFSIAMRANICCVKYNPASSNHIAVGSADHNIHYFDLRNPSSPLSVFRGHRKAVSYVKFLSQNELASASTDSTLRLWDVQTDCSVRTLRGHTNDKNFVGLTVNSEYIACGSETNEVFVYHKGRFTRGVKPCMWPMKGKHPSHMAMSQPSTYHDFGSSNTDEFEDISGNFISAACWKSESPTMLAANSQGTVKVLTLAP